MNEELKALMRDIERLGWKAAHNYGGDITITVAVNELATEDTGGCFTNDRNKTELVRHFGQAEGGY